MTVRELSDLTHKLISDGYENANVVIGDKDVTHIIARPQCAVYRPGSRYMATEYATPHVELVTE